jgi:L-serine/L-threonine ammonia-lyase
MKVVTPLTESATLGATSKRRVLCKLDSLQRSGSFKYRGISALAHDLKKQGKTMLVAPSGGNAGMAAATAAKDLGLECVVYVPKSTSEFMRKKLEGAGARVVVHGEHFSEADLAAKEFVAHQGAAAGYVHAC